MHRTFVVAAFALATSIACATPSLPEIDSRHPASPLAPEAALVPASSALAEEPSPEPEDDRAAEPTPSGQHGAHHGH